MVKSFWSRRITIGAVFIMLLLSGCGNGSSGQNVTEDPADIESLTDATPVTADEYGKYIEKQLLDVIAEQLNMDDADIKTVISDDLVVQEVSIDTGARELSEDDKDNLIKQIKVFCGNDVSITFSGEKGEAPYMSDYEVLWDELRYSYPYLPCLEEKGIDVDEIYDRYAEKTKDITEEDDFYGMLQNMLAELQNFAHLNIASPEDYASLYNIFVNDDYYRETEKTYYEIVTDPKLSKRYKVPESSEQFVQDTQEQFPDVFMQYIADCKALYIKIPSFHYELVDRDSNIVYEGLKKYPETENIIFDITTTGGGSDGYWMENLVAPFGGTYEFGYRSFFKSTPLINKYYADSESKPVSELSDAPEWASELGLDRYYTNTWTLSEEDFDGEIIDRDIKKWVLISNRVYSASEKFVCFCKATGWATLVGTKTSGDGLGPTPVMLLLPDSGLLIRFSGNVGENPDGSINAVAGTNPDITCQKKETPLERCLEEIRGIIK